MLKTAIIYRIDPEWKMPHMAALEDALSSAVFTSCGPTQQKSFGWVDPRGEKHGALIENVGGHFIFKQKVEVRAVPASVVKEKLEERIAEILNSTGRKPGSKEKKALKEEILLELLPHAFTKSSTTMLWLDPQNKCLVVGAASNSKADSMVGALIEAMALAGNSLALTPLNTNTSPSSAMSHWLVTQQAPYHFTVDRECELKRTDSERSAVKYSRHTLEIDEIVDHIRAGKMVTQLALTWSDRVSIVLTQALSIKKIAFIETSSISDAKGKDKGIDFDTDVAITTGELSKLIPDLIEALDGEAVNGMSNDHGNDAAHDQIHDQDNSQNDDAKSEGFALETEDF